MREPRQMGCGAGCRGWPLRSGRRRPGIFCRPGEHRRPRDTGGTHPGRISCVWNVGTPTGSGGATCAGEPTAREAQSPSGGRMSWEANAGGRKATGNRGGVAGTSARRLGELTGSGRGARTRKGADAGRVSLWRTTWRRIRNRRTSWAPCRMVAVVNGPEGDCLDWGAVDSPKVEDEVGRLRQRIFTASQVGDLRKDRNLQKLMLRSRANASGERSASDSTERWPQDGGRRQGWSW